MVGSLEKLVGMSRREFDLDLISRSLSFAAAVPDLRAALRDSRTAVVSAPPGTGKTTLVPPVVAGLVPGKVVVTQPRRVAARAAARRLAALDGTPLGDRVGFAVRGETTTSPGTIVDVMTAGVLLRRLLDDPELAGIGAVIVDEVHERSLESDLLMGLLTDVTALREDLVVIAMSATIDAAAFATVLAHGGTPAPIVAHDVPAHPLVVHYAPSPGARLTEHGVTSDFLRHVARTAVDAHRAALATDSSADALVFVPGAREVAAVAQAAAQMAPELDVRELHGGMRAHDQDAIIAGRRASAPARMIISTSLAESSLTVPGVRLVIDSALARVPQRDSIRGMTGLVTVPASRAAAIQRAGRATRQGPGMVIRCTDERTFAAAPARPAPEIATSDLTDAALLLACWGTPGGEGLSLLTPPPADALTDAVRALTVRGALDSDGRVSAKGRQLGRIPVDARLAHALCDGATRVAVDDAADIVALLASEPRTPDADAAAVWRAIRSGRHADVRTWQRESHRLRRHISTVSADRSASRPDDDLSWMIALAYPERIARRVDRTARGATYLLASGTRAGLTGPLADAEWLAVADVSRAHSRAAAGSGAVIRLAAALSLRDAEDAAGTLVSEEVKVTFLGGRLSARRERMLGAIVLSSTAIAPTPDQTTLRAIADALQAHGLEMFGWSEEAQALRNRLAFLHRVIGTPWPEVSTRALLHDSETTWGPEIARVAEGTPAAKVDATAALRRLLPWPQASDFDRLAPERLQVPSGSSVSIRYPAHDDDTGRPIVAVKLQECFGWAQTPRLADEKVPVLFHLLSPAGRPVAVTDDLASFWSGPYRDVRAEMRGRYPKHPWPEDPWTAVPTRHTTRRASQ